MAQPNDTERPRDAALGDRRLGAIVYAGVVALAAAGPGWSARLGRRLPRTAEPIVLAGTVAGSAAAVATLERVRPYRDDWSVDHGDVLEDTALLGAGVVVSFLSGALVDLVVRPNLWQRGSPLRRLPTAAQVVVVVGVTELFHTSLHRLVHRWTPLWRRHAVHHGARRLYWLNTTRFHPLEAVMVAAGDHVVVAALGVSRQAELSYRVLRGAFGQVQHSNVAIDSGPLNAVLSTPERHRWHHSSRPAESEANYGSIVCLWDRVMGCSYLPSGTEGVGRLGVRVASG